MRTSRVRSGSPVVSVSVLLSFVRTFFGVVLLAVPMSVSTQEPDLGQSNQSLDAPDSVVSGGRVSPGGAFLRSLVIPGWGQAASGSPNRGAFYFTLESFSAWMILKTSKTLGSAQDILALRISEAEFRMQSEGIDPVEIPSKVDSDPAVQSARDLEETRLQQREDWFAFALFFLFLGGADAFVAAHLADFPEPLEVQIQALPDMGFEIGFKFFYDPFHP